MSHIEIKDDSDYKIKIPEMKIGEKVECPDQSSEVEKTAEGCKIKLSKSCLIKKV